MPGLFICYRRDDSAGHAGRLFDSMREAFGQHRVFMDLTAIEGGEDFAEVIKRAVSSSDVMLAVIGREWLTATDERGKRRLDDPDDFIPLELGTALAGKVRVIPVLVEGARMPKAAELPEVLKPLARRQAVELRDSRWSADVQELVDLLRKTPLGAGDGEDAREAPPIAGRRRGTWPIWTGAALAVIVAAVLAFNYLSFEGSHGPSPSFHPSPAVRQPSPIVPQPSPTAPEPSPSPPEPSPTAPRFPERATSEPDRVKVKQMVRVRQTFMVDVDEGRVASGRDADVWFEAVTASERYLSPVHGASLAAPARRARLADCVNARYGVPRIALAGVKAGAEFCVRTNGGRYGVVQISRDLAPDSTSLVLGVLTWEAARR